MKIEPSGVVLSGVCSVQTAKCTAKDKPGALTAVWSTPARRQINVCGGCLTEMIASGQWESETPLVLPPSPA